MSTSTPPAARDAPRFHEARPDDLRAARPWHRLAYVIRTLPAALRRLSAHWRWTCSGLRKAVEDAGLEIVAFEGIVGMAATGLQLVLDSMYWKLPRLLRAPVALVVQILIALADRLEPRASKDMNALVFAVVAHRP